MPNQIFLLIVHLKATEIDQNIFNTGGYISMYFIIKLQRRRAKTHVKKYVLLKMF